MHLARNIDTPTGNPLRALQTSGGNLRLPTIAGATAPGDAVCLQNRGLDTVLSRQMYGAGKTSITRANDNNIDIQIVRDRTIVLWCRPCCADPVGRRIVFTNARAGRVVRIVGRIEGLSLGLYEIGVLLHGFVPVLLTRL